MRDRFDVIVIGGGHAGIEAALASERLGCTVALVTSKVMRIGEMSCNPAIGGIAKGTMVREIDVLDGSMARSADMTRLQFKMLNRRKGPAVWGPRVQSDAQGYSASQKSFLMGSSVVVIEDEVTGLLGRTERVDGVVCRRGGPVRGSAVVIAAGTFLRGRLFRGGEYWRGGRRGDISADSLEKDLVRRMFHVERFKTGTSPRVVRRTVDLEVLEREPSEDSDFSFSFDGTGPEGPEESFYFTSTDVSTVRAARDYLHLSPLLAGGIEGKGPRYCPSFEDKVVKFPDRCCHRIYVEPEGYRSRLLYLNGLSSSLPREAQVRMVRSLPGFARAEIAIFGYAVEYSFFHWSEIDRTLRLRRSSNLFAAGQVCGTSGYEEAAALGTVAGANAARTVKDLEPTCMSRMNSYIGVMIDDITSKGVDEPYRMFTSRAENRLHIRLDNADRRLFEEAESMGLLSPSRRDLLLQRIRSAHEAAAMLREEERVRVLCRRPGTSVDDICRVSPRCLGIDRGILRSVMLDERYSGYIERNTREFRSRISASSISLGSIGSYMEMRELCLEAREALERERPGTLADACRMPAVRPTDIQGIIIHLARERSTWNT